MKRGRLRRVGRTKYGVRKDAAGVRGRTYGGVEYHSALEARYAAKLDLLKDAIGPERIDSWKRQVVIKLEVNGVLVCKYIMDFVVNYADGHTEYHEVKGYETDVWRIKWKLANALYPDRRFVVIKNA